MHVHCYGPKQKVTQCICKKLLTQVSQGSLVKLTKAKILAFCQFSVCRKTNHTSSRFIWLLTLYHTIPTFNLTPPHTHTPPSTEKPLENFVEKGENAGNQHFLLFPQCFLPFTKQISNFQSTFTLSYAHALNLDKSVILSFGKKLKMKRRNEEYNCIIGSICGSCHWPVPKYRPI